MKKIILIIFLVLISINYTFAFTFQESLGPKDFFDSVNDVVIGEVIENNTYKKEFNGVGINPNTLEVNIKFKVLKTIKGNVSSDTINYTNLIFGGGHDSNTHLQYAKKGEIYTLYLGFENSKGFYDLYFKNNDKYSSYSNAYIYLFILEYYYYIGLAIFSIILLFLLKYKKYKIYIILIYFLIVINILIKIYTLEMQNFLNKNNVINESNTKITIWEDGKIEEKNIKNYDFINFLSEYSTKNYLYIRDMEFNNYLINLELINNGKLYELLNKSNIKLNILKFYSGVNIIDMRKVLDYLDSNSSKYFSESFMLEVDYEKFGINVLSMLNNELLNNFSLYLNDLDCSENDFYYSRPEIFIDKKTEKFILDRKVKDFHIGTSCKGNNAGLQNLIVHFESGYNDKEVSDKFDILIMGEIK